ncbi:DNA polymerase III subunit psi [Aeromonas taiwanensis]|uniref:DNA polymerase III subunit psi n=1 Tax=Aeromonas taiwanensis TaxID=633417 RepID=UPI00248EE158|nr:DNA polymerase III subunit psi [Aeromonas taiwanensis]
MQDPLLDPLRQRILARMGIAVWQLRGQALPGQTPAPMQEAEPTQAEIGHSPVAAALPPGKLWLQADALPSPSLLGDICRWLGLGTDEVSLLARIPALPEGTTPPLIWLTAPDARWPDALICPLAPDAAHKRALWQQCRHRQPG